MPEHPGIFPVLAAILVFTGTILSAGCASSQNPPASPAAATTAAAAAGQGSVAIKDFAFSPATLTVPTGTTVTWTNREGVDHQIASDPGAPVAFSSGPLRRGETFPVTFSTPGTYAYHCTIHPSMKATVVVT